MERTEGSYVLAGARMIGGEPLRSPRGRRRSGRWRVCSLPRLACSAGIEGPFERRSKTSACARPTAAPGASRRLRSLLIGTVFLVSAVVLVF